MGQDMGVVAVVDTLAVLREQSIWRQNPADLARPSRPPYFKLTGEHAVCCLRLGGWSVFCSLALFSELGGRLRHFCTLIAALVSGCLAIDRDAFGPGSQFPGPSPRPPGTPFSLRCWLTDEGG